MVPSMTCVHDARARVVGVVGGHQRRGLVPQQPLQRPGLARPLERRVDLLRRDPALLFDLEDAVVTLLSLISVFSRKSQAGSQPVARSGGVRQTAGGPRAPLRGSLRCRPLQGVRRPRLRLGHVLHLHHRPHVRHARRVLRRRRLRRGLRQVHHRPHLTPL
jgi:hypothetical protein